MNKRQTVRKKSTLCHITNVTWIEYQRRDACTTQFCDIWGPASITFVDFFPLLLCSFTTAMDLLTFLGGFCLSLKNRSSSKILLFSFFPEVFFCRMSAAKYNAARTSSLSESLKRHSIQHKKYKTAEMVSITKWKFNTYPPHFKKNYPYMML